MTISHDDKEVRLERLRRFMREHNITYRAIGDKLGISEPRVFAMLRQNTYFQGYHDKLIELGFPTDTLPYPVHAPKARRRPIFPGLQNKQSPLQPAAG